MKIENAVIDYGSEGEQRRATKGQSVTIVECPKCKRFVTGDSFRRHVGESHDGDKRILRVKMHEVQVFDGGVMFVLART